MRSTWTKPQQMMTQLHDRGYGGLQTEGYIVEKMLYEGDRSVSGDPSDWSDCLLDDVKTYYGPAWYNHAIDSWNFISANLEQTFSSNWGILHEMLDTKAAKIYDCNECKHKLACLIDRATDKHFETNDIAK